VFGPKNPAWKTRIDVSSELYSAIGHRYAVMHDMGPGWKHYCAAWFPKNLKRTEELISDLCLRAGIKWVNRESWTERIKHAEKYKERVSDNKPDI
jgi:hypothetical protein